MVVLSVSFVLPFVGYLIGAGLVLASKAWAGHDKALALLIPPFVVVGERALEGAALVLPPPFASGIPRRPNLREAGTVTGSNPVRGARWSLPSGSCVSCSAWNTVAPSGLGCSQWSPHCS